VREKKKLQKAKKESKNDEKPKSGLKFISSFLGKPGLETKVKEKTR